jgi:Flp pilus assembly protein TadG
VSVEVAICLPILFAFLFAGYELARANMLLHAAESAAYEGARVGIVPGATPAKIRTAAEFVLNSVGVSDFNVRITPPIIDNQTPRVLVEIEVPFRGNTSIPTFFIDTPVFRGQCDLARETL